jgi:uncharacterized membrane protein YedE/YeeE
MAEPNLVLGFLGGMLIGLATVLLLALNGRIAGVSGILSGAVTAPDRFDRSWRLLFILGLMAGAALYRVFSGALPVQIEAGMPTLVVAGLLVGFGTRLGSGCTSGHGVCGLARLSPRSLTATITFMLFGMLTVYLTRHLF